MMAVWVKKNELLNICTVGALPCGIVIIALLVGANCACDAA